MFNFLEKDVDILFNAKGDADLDFLLRAARSVFRDFPVRWTMSSQRAFSTAALARRFP